MRRSPRHGQRTRLRERQCHRLPRKKRPFHSCQARKWRVADAEGALRRKAFGNYARSVSARRAWVTRVFSEHVEHVTEVQAHRTHTEQYFVISDCKDGGLRLEKEIADRTSGMKVQPHSTVDGWRCRP